MILQMFILLLLLFPLLLALGVNCYAILSSYKSLSFSTSLYYLMPLFKPKINKEIKSNIFFKVGALSYIRRTLIWTIFCSMSMIELKEGTDHQEQIWRRVWPELLSKEKQLRGEGNAINLQGSYISWNIVY